MIVSVREVTKRYGRAKALEDVSLDIPPGQIVAVLGANGAGKSTLLRCLAGLVRPDQGVIRMDGEPLLRERIDLRQRFFFLPDFPFLFHYFDGARQVGITLELYGKVVEGIEQTVAELFQEFDMLEHDNVACAALSRGQAYKVGLISLLAVDPELWLLDEPFASGMDPLGIQAFKRHALAAARRGTTIVYSTQILEVAESFSDMVCVLHKGRLRACESVESLRERMGTPEDALMELFRRLRQEGEG